MSEQTFYGITITPEQSKDFKLGEKVRVTIEGEITELRNAKEFPVGEGEEPDASKRKPIIEVSADSVKVEEIGDNEFKDLAKSEE